MKKNSITLGSLFDGIGAVPYAASFFGINAIWASEILPNAVSVTKRHFPEMEHLGDITKLDGGKMPPAQVIAFGSPCQSYTAEFVIPHKTKNPLIKRVLMKNIGNNKSYFKPDMRRIASSLPSHTATGVGVELRC